MYERIKQAELSFAGERLIVEKHKMHPYPAMFHPLLADHLIKKYTKDNEIIFDPFCGSGVTLLQAGLNNHKAFGFDINPLALLIAKAKTMNYEIDVLKNDFIKLQYDLKNCKEFDLPKITNIDFWYSLEVQSDLAKIRYILKNNDYKYKALFIVCFAFICRNQSYTRKGEFKRFRIAASKLGNAKNTVFKSFFEHLESMIEIIENSKNPKKKLETILFNSENEIPQKYQYDFVLTSPPYGDSRTTVAYGQYTSFGMEWTNDINDFGEIDYKVDNEGLGKKNIVNDDIYKNIFLIETINKIKAIDKKRSDDVLYFFNGYYKSLKNVVTNLSDKGRVCFIVGNRTVKGVKIPMDQITANFFEQLGLKFENIFTRDIHNKVMPSRNSPTNQAGVTKKTMMNEFIVVCSKQ